jgi:hypothetical protein
MSNIKHVKSKTYAIGMAAKKVIMIPRNTRYLKSRKSALSTSIVIVTAIIMTAGFVFELSNNNNIAMAQSDIFSQPVRVNVDKTDRSLGDYGLSLRDTDTGNHVEQLYTDSINSPQSIHIDGSIGVHDGDRVVACMMQMSTKEIACDTQTANLSDSVTEFFIDMSNAQTVSDGQSGIDQFQGVGSPSS